jgi:hypothetical protein
MQMSVVGSRTITYYPTTQYNTKKKLNFNSSTLHALCSTHQSSFTVSLLKEDEKMEEEKNNHISGAETPNTQ